MYNIEWSQILGASGDSEKNSTFAYDIDQSIHTSSYVVGRASIGNGNDPDSFISKVSPSGTEIWRKYKSSVYDIGFTSIATNPEGTEIYVGGSVSVYGKTEPQSVFGQNYLGGGSDGFIIKYDDSGNEIWTRLFGASGFDSISSVSVDFEGNIVATGATNIGTDLDVLTIKVDPDGTTIWKDVLSSGTSIQWGNVILTDSNGAIYIAGRTEGELDGQLFLGGGTDTFISKYSKDGIKQGTIILGTTGDDFVGDIELGDDGSIYLSGFTNGDLYGESAIGGEDAFLLKANIATAEVDWAKLIGTGSDDYGRNIVVADDNYIYFSGYTFGDLGGNPSAGGSDIFITRFSPTGLQDSVALFGSSGYEESQGLKVDENGYIYVVGATWGDPFNDVTTNANLSRPQAFVTQLSSASESAPVHISDITTQDQLTTFEVTGPVLINDLYIETVIIGTKGKDKIVGTSNGEILAGQEGKDILIGRGGSDGFFFQNPAGSSKKEVDRVKDFDSEEGDFILVDKDFFGQIDEVVLKTVSSKRATRRASKTNHNFVYDNKKGLLYFNENGSDKGWGDGGLFVKLQNAPELGESDFMIV